jgi:hypothetical protein
MSLAPLTRVCATYMWRLAAALVACVLAWPHAARAQLTVVAPDTTGRDPYESTLTYGTGLIDDPVAWVSPASSDFWLTYGVTRIPSVPGPVSSSPFRYGNGNLSLDTHWLKRFSVGVSLYSNNPEWGAFGQFLLLRDGDIAFLPGIAIGARNVGPFDHEDRYLVGHDITVDSLGHQHTFTPPFYANFHTAPSLYIVATKEILLPDAPLTFTSLSFTVGGGDGVFNDDGGQGAAYNRHGTVVSGLFFGVRAVSRPTPNTVIAIMAENNGFDYNAGIVATWRGIGLGVYGKELEESWRRSPSGYLVYNYKKIAMNFIYNGNFSQLTHGSVLRAQISGFTRERRRLRAEIERRDKKVRLLEQQLVALEGSDLAEVARQRAALEQQLEQEREAIRRAEERLKQLEGTPPQ